MRSLRGRVHQPMLVHALEEWGANNTMLSNPNCVRGRPIGKIVLWRSRESRRLRSACVAVPVLNVQAAVTVALPDLIPSTASTSTCFV